MAQKVNNIEQKDIETKEERRWFNFFRHTAEKLNYGSIECIVTIKGGKIVAIKNIKSIESFNISE